jgi:hypothetical protein
MGSRLSVCWQWSTIEWESYSVSWKSHAECWPELGSVCP